MRTAKTSKTAKILFLTFADFADTDTLYIEFREAAILETKDLDENTIMDFDRDGNICAITIEHARERTQIPSFSYEQVPA